MKNTIKKIPIPLCGVMLGLAALGNLLQSYSEGTNQPITRTQLEAQNKVSDKQT